MESAKHEIAKENSSENKNESAKETSEIKFTHWGTTWGRGQKLRRGKERYQIRRRKNK